MLEPEASLAQAVQWEQAEVWGFPLVPKQTLHFD
jgi:hypothetical protein